MDNDGKLQIKLIEIKKQKGNISQSKTQVSKQANSLSKIKDKKEPNKQKKSSISSATSNNKATNQTKSKPNQLQKISVENPNYNHSESPAIKRNIEKGNSKTLKEVDENEVFSNLIKNAKKGDRVAFMNSIEV